VGLRSAISANERLQQLYHPWTSYIIVPLFALANAGIVLDAGFLGRAFRSPITLGILVGCRRRQAGGRARRLVARREGDRRSASSSGRLGPPLRAAVRLRASASPSRS